MLSGPEYTHSQIWEACGFGHNISKKWSEDACALGAPRAQRSPGSQTLGMGGMVFWFTTSVSDGPILRTRAPQAQRSQSCEMGVTWLHVVLKSDGA